MPSFSDFAGFEGFYFVVAAPSRAGARPHQYDFVLRHTFKPRVGLSTQNHVPKIT